MHFKTVQAVEMKVYECKQADFIRARNRSLINDLFDGVPPYTEADEKANGIEVNVNFLEGTRLAHDARQQYANAFNKPGNFFTASTDTGAQHKRQQRSTSFTNRINRAMKRSTAYYEKDRSQFALNVLHGIGPCVWNDRETWCPNAAGIEDVMVPSGTLLAMNNLEFFAVFKSFTAHELARMTRGPNVDKAWNLPLAKSCLEWADKQAASHMGLTYNDVWSPERLGQRYKEDGGLYALDAVPTIDCWDVYFYNDDDKHSGWNRRIILDADWSNDARGGLVFSPNKLNKDYKDGFLYNPGKRKYADRRSELITWQFADLSAVAPFRYHTVRSLGFMLWAVCNLQNRLRCKFSEASFEGLLQLLRVKTYDDAERALKINWYNRGIIDESVQFVPPEERWQPNVQLAELAMRENQQLITDNSSSWVQNQNFSRDRTEKTKFQVQAEVNAVVSLVSASLMQAYRYRADEYREIVRRFCVPNSRDMDVREFRLGCLKDGIPERMLVPECWEIEPERVMGAGNKTLELQVANWLMEHRNIYDPEPQRVILRRATLAVSDDPGLTDELVPDQPVQITDAVHDAQLATGTLMMGLPVGLKTGINHIEYIETLLANMAMVIKRIETTDNTGTEEQIIGLQNMAAHIGQHLNVLAQDKNEKQRVRQYADQVGQLMNLVKGFAQRLAEKQAQSNGNGIDPELQAKVMAIAETTKVKLQGKQMSDAQKRANQQAKFVSDQQRKQDEHMLEMQRELQRTQVEDASLDIKTAAEIRRDAVNAETEPTSKSE